MNQANITRLLTLAKTGQPKGYAGSEMMQADLDAVLSALVSVDSVNTSSEYVDETANYRHEQAEQSSYAATPTTLAEPVACDEHCKYDDGICMKHHYATPVRTKDLTASEIRDIWNSSDNYDVFCVEFARAVNAADREKNK